MVLISYITNNNINIHQNLKYYKYYYEIEGFILNSNKCHNNPFWMEAVKYIK